MQVPKNVLTNFIGLKKRFALTLQNYTQNLCPYKTVNLWGQGVDKEEKIRFNVTMGIIFKWNYFMILEGELSWYILVIVYRIATASEKCLIVKLKVKLPIARWESVNHEKAKIHSFSTPCSTELDCEFHWDPHVGQESESEHPKKGDE